MNRDRAGVLVRVQKARCLACGLALGAGCQWEGSAIPVLDGGSVMGGAYGATPPEESTEEDRDARPDPPPERLPADTPFTCSGRMDTARVELLGAGFAPANDTPSWLTLTIEKPRVLLSIFTEYSPDGDGYRTFQAEFEPAARKALVGPWRLVRRDVLDEFKEERLAERTWTRTQAGWTARIHTRSENRRWVGLFERIVRPALEDCLAHPTMP
jgi:hypothetical protein